MPINLVPENRIAFRWDYFARLLKAFAFFGVVTLATNFHQVAKAYVEIGLVGFAEVALWLIGFSFLVVRCNYLWCRGLQEFRRQGRAQSRRQTSGELPEG